MRLKAGEDRLQIVATQIQRIFNRCAGARARILAAQVLQRVGDQPGLPDDDQVGALVRRIHGETPRTERAPESGGGSSSSRVGVPSIAGVDRVVAKGVERSRASRANAAASAFPKSNARIQQEQVARGLAKQMGSSADLAAALIPGQRFKGPDPTNPNVWSLIAAKQKREQESEKVRDAEASAVQKQEWRRALGTQVKFAADVVAAERAQDEAYARGKEVELAGWKKLETRKAAASKARADAQAKAQAQQRMANIRAREAESRAKKADDARMVEVIRRQEQRDKVEAREAKRERKTEQDRVKTENAAVLRGKEKKLEQAQREEVKLAAEYEEREASKEAKRVAHLADMAARIEKKMAMGSDAVHQADNRAQADERRMIIAQEQYRVQREAADRNKSVLVRSRARECKDTLAQQVAQRKALQEQNRRDLREQAVLWKAKADDQERAEQEKKAATLRKRKEHQAWLKQQMAQRATVDDLNDASEEELKLNRSLLRSAGAEMLRR